MDAAIRYHEQLKHLRDEKIVSVFIASRVIPYAHNHKNENVIAHSTRKKFTTENIRGYPSLSLTFQSGNG